MAIKLTNIVIVGSGGHAKVVADALVSHPNNGLDYTIVGFVDEDEAKRGETVEGRPILGPMSMLESLRQERGNLGVIVAIGDNERRRAVFEELAGRGFEFASAVHRNACVADTVKIGRGVLVAAGVVVNSDARIGDDAILNTGCTIDHDCVIGAHAHVGPGVNVCGTVSIGDGTLIGVGSSVIPNVTIGAHVLVGAGAAVTGDLPDGAKVGGVPAKEL